MNIQFRLLCLGERIMWPVKVEGPRAVTTVEDILVQCDFFGPYPRKNKWSLVIFGEEHDNPQCKGPVRDIVRAQSDEYVRTGDQPGITTWTIGRLLVDLADKVRKDYMDYFIEQEFEYGAPRIEREAGSWHIPRLRHLFLPCLSRDKSGCGFLPHLFVHAIDYRGDWPEFIDVQDLSLREIQEFIIAVLNDEYSLLRHWLSLDEFNAYREMLFPTKPTHGHFFPLTLFIKFYRIFSPYFDSRHTLSTASVTLLVKTITALYGAEFDVADLLIMFLTYETPVYVDWVKQRRDILDEILPLWDSLLMGGSLRTVTEYGIMIQVMHALRIFRSECNFISRGQHKSVKLHEGVIVSRASLQLYKVRKCVLDQSYGSIETLLLHWIDYKRAYLSTGYVWQGAFRTGIPSDLFFVRCFYDTALFLDAPAIARIFQRNAQLSVAYLGDAHRENWRDFFEFCGLASTTTMARHGNCLVFPDHVKKLFDQMN